jgi:hypothetical protein
LRDGQTPQNLEGLASPELTVQLTREAAAKARTAAYLGLKR